MLSRSGFVHLLLPPFDFSAALPLPSQERTARAAAKIAASPAGPGRPDVFGPLTVYAPEAADEAVRLFEQRVGVTLPSEYAIFLRHCRQLGRETGATLFGLADGDGGESYGTPWLSEDHPLPGGGRYLVVGDYFRYADGDQLLLPLDTSDPPVLLYRHENGPSCEQYAPSFSLAVWRLAFESW